MKLTPLYRLRLTYPQGWRANLTGSDGTEGRYFYFAEGTCDGRITGRFRGANHPQRRTDRTFQTDLQGVIETADGAAILVDIQGYGRPHPIGRRQVVMALRHVCESERYHWLNDALCVAVGEVRSMGREEEPTAADESTPAATIRSNILVVLDVAELVWEPVPE